MPTGQVVLAIGYEDIADSVRWQIDRLKTELGRTDIAILEGADAWPLVAGPDRLSGGTGWAPVSFVANLRPSSVASFVEGLDPDDGPAKRTPATGSSVPMHWATGRSRRRRGQIEKFRNMAVQDGGNLILSRCPDRVEGAPARLGQARARLGHRRTGQSGPRPSCSHEPGTICWSHLMVSG